MTPRLRVVIVDDLALARERVARYLADEPDLDVVGEAASGADAIRLISREGPDIAFLDIGLPDFDGFEIIRRLPRECAPIVIYLTAHGEKALEAFDLSASDFLAKPFSRERFDRALGRARQALSARRGEPQTRLYLKRLAVKEGGRTDLVDVGDIDYVEVAGHYLCVHVGQAVRLVRGQMSDLEEKLDPAEFVRIHRSILVRTDRISALAEGRNGDGEIILKSGPRLIMSRTWRDRIRHRLGAGLP